MKRREHPLNSLSQPTHQSGESSDAGQGLNIPERDAVSPGLVELDADAVAGVSLQHVLQLHLGVLVHVDATLKG